MGWQEDEAEKRCKKSQEEGEIRAAKSRKESAEFDAVNGFWKKLVVANEKILYAVRAVYLQSPLNESLKGSHCSINYKRDIDKGETIISNCACKKKCCCRPVVEIRYSHVEKRLILSLPFARRRFHNGRVKIEDEHIDMILRSICTGQQFWEGIVESLS
jgi:hypothetical protein